MLEQKQFFIPPAIIEDFDFYFEERKVLVKQVGANIIIHWNRNISSKLFDNIKNKKAGEAYIIGYTSKILPKINQEILKQRYSNEHFLIKYFSTLDILKISIYKNSSMEIAPLTYPKSITPFSLSQKLGKGIDEIFIRDLLDAGNAYFNYNLDECIRKIITSLENSFIFLKHKGSKKGLFSRKKGFKNIIKNIYSGDLKNKDIENNLLFIYKVRNKIVHRKFRVKFSNNWFCKKSVITLFYHYKTQCKNNIPLKDYILSLEMQFRMIDDFCRGQTPEDIINIDRFERNLKIDNGEMSIILKG